MQGLCHISELTSDKKLARVEDFVNEGDFLDVKLIEVRCFMVYLLFTYCMFFLSN
jgi:ribosomal protein S1